jgi:glycosyltransferase involved in cell wall biosynthesis
MFSFNIDNEVILKCISNTNHKTGVFKYSTNLNDKLPANTLLVKCLEKISITVHSQTRRHFFLKIYKKTLEYSIHQSLKSGKKTVIHKPWYGKWHNSFHDQKNLKKILTIHDCIAYEHPEWFEVNINNLLLRWSECIKQADFFIFVSESSRDDFLRRFSGVSRDKTAVTYLGPSLHVRKKHTNSFDVHNHFGIPKNKPYFLSVCTLEPRKNLLRLIEAFSQFKRRTRSHVSLVLTGAAGWGVDLISAINKNHLSHEDVVVTGYVPDDILPCLYTSSMAFIYPSLYEGFGLPVLDAMSMGIPTISSNISSIPEVCADAAILIDPYDVNEISNALESVYYDSDLRFFLKKRSVDRAAQLSWDKCVRSTLDAYKAAFEC